MHVMGGNQFQSALSYAQGGSYMTGGANVRNDLALAAQRDLAKAQREAGLPAARSEIAGQGKYERGDMPPAAEASSGPDPLRAAIVAPDPDQIVSGDAAPTRS